MVHFAIVNQIYCLLNLCEGKCSEKGFTFIGVYVEAAEGGRILLNVALFGIGFIFAYEKEQ